MAMVCFQHPRTPSAGTCCHCSVGLCAPCVRAHYPPSCPRCIQAATLIAQRGAIAGSISELEAIGSRAVTASILAGIGAFIVWSACTLLALLGVPFQQPLAALVADHGIGLLGVGAYVIGSAPYGWFVAGEWLVPPKSAGPYARAQALQSATLATIAIGPFVAPAGIIHDVRRFRELRRGQRRAAARAWTSSEDSRLTAARGELPMKRAIPAPQPRASLDGKTRNHED